MQSLAQKYFSRAVAANVTVSPGPHSDFICDIVAPVANGVVLKRIIVRRRRTSRSKVRATRSKSSCAAMRSASASTRAMVSINSWRPRATPFSRPRPKRRMPEADHPAIVAETKVDIPEASVSDAVMLLDLRNTNALMFKNRASGELNMIYRRDDGNIGWVEPPAR